MMKKRLTSLALLCLLCLLLALPALADGKRDLDLVVDTCGLLTAAQDEELNAKAERYSAQYGCEIILVVVPDTEGYDVEYYTEEVYRYYNFGWGTDKSGVILLLSMEERDYDLAAYGYGNTAFTDFGKQQLMKDVRSYLKKNDWYGGFSRYIDLCADYLRQAREGKPVDRGLFRLSAPVVIWSLVAGVIFALIVTAVLKAKMKSAVLQTKADDYLSGDLRVDYEDDRFLRKDVVRVRRNEGSGGGRGGTSVRSSGFSHHSGKF
jgi:uncharacterized protein